MTSTHNQHQRRTLGIRAAILPAALCVLVLGSLLLFPATTHAASLAYLEANADDFIEDTLLKYGEMINIAGLLYDYDPNLILAVIIVESEGNHQAVSNKGAQGLMQLMPATAKSLGVKNSKEPFQNILAGTRYLRELERWHGFDGPTEALVAYNMGPSRAKRWLSQHGPEEFLYVRKVMYVYEVASATSAEKARLALADAAEGSDGDGAASEEDVFSRPIMTKPRTFSLAAFPMTLPSARRTETNDLE